MDALLADERTAAWVANGCVIASGLLPPPLVALPRGVCPRAEIVLDEDDQILRGRSMRIVVTCVTAPASGCRGTARLKHGVAIGRGRFRIPAGARRVVRVTFPSPALRHLRRLLRREGDVFLDMDAHVKDGRTSRSAGTPGAVIDRAIGGG